VREGGGQKGREGTHRQNQIQNQIQNQKGKLITKNAYAHGQKPEKEKVREG
jgi:hypothetical protein